MQIIGHRGASGYTSENTLSSFQKAIALGVDMIELDVYVIKTGEVVVFHDKTVDRTTNGFGKIENYTFNELRKLDAGNGEKVPLLTEVLDLLHKRLAINIELKGKGTAKPVADIIRYYVTKKNWNSSLFLVTSFNQEEITTFAKHYPAIQVGVLFASKSAKYNVLAKTRNAYALNMNAENITRKNVQQIHAHNMKVFAYTVNTKADARRMARMKVDGIFTNYPDRFATR